jgi:hypothetical protein
VWERGVSVRMGGGGVLYTRWESGRMEMGRVELMGRDVCGDPEVALCRAF